MFEADPEKFSKLFQRVTQLLIGDDLPVTCQRGLFVFLTNCFQSFENVSVRTEYLKLVTIGIWTNLASDSKRENLFSEYPSLQKLWDSSNKKLNAAGNSKRDNKQELFSNSDLDKSKKEQLEYERSWLSSLLKKFIPLVYKIPAEGEGLLKNKHIFFFFF